MTTQITPLSTVPGPTSVVPLTAVQQRIPDPPPELDGKALELWPRVAKELVARNVYDSDVRDQVAIYCMEWARYLQATECVNDLGIMITRKWKRSKGRTEVCSSPNPAVRIAQSAFLNMLKLAKELGLTPASRIHAKRVKLASPETAASKYLRAKMRA